MFTKSWECVSDIGVSQQRFTACGLIDKIYICGGVRPHRLDNTRFEDTHRVFNTKDFTWNVIAKMKHNKHYAASSAYQGKMVVSGGIDNSLQRSSNLVEAYDHTVDEWIEMPSMINARHCHSQLTLRNKFFVIGKKKR